MTFGAVTSFFSRNIGSIGSVAFGVGAMVGGGVAGFGGGAFASMGLTPALQQAKENVSKLLVPFVQFGTFIFGMANTMLQIPSPEHIRVKINKKLVELPIINMDGSVLQDLGRHAPVVEFEGEMFDPYAEAAIIIFLSQERLLKFAMPSSCSYLPNFRMMKLHKFEYDNIKGRPGDIRYKCVLKQDRNRGFP